MPLPFNKEPGTQVIKNALFRRGMRQKELAAALDISEPELTNILGQRLPLLRFREDQVDAVANLLDLTDDERATVRAAHGYGASRPRFRLVDRTAGRNGRFYPLKAFETTIGSDEQNTIVECHEQVSLQHAEILWERNRFNVRDCGSTNGTYIDHGTNPCRCRRPNGSPTERDSGPCRVGRDPVVLQPGDTVLICKNPPRLILQFQENQTAVQ